MNAQSDFSFETGYNEIMSLKKKLEDELKQAIRTGDDLRKRTLRMAISAIKLAEVDKGEPLEDSAILGILQKEVKSRRETIDEAAQAGRHELASATSDEISVLESYLPKQLDDKELEALARKAILEVGASSPADMGKVMKLIMPRVKGIADGVRVSQVVKNLLEQS
ncbi:MAG: GatB/YqeY domain-containing protein [Anaerolineales bacterium]|nr:GatB/YqeY domain-containing protein [Anaerolineales bacterium]